MPGAGGCGLRGEGCGLLREVGGGEGRGPPRLRSPSQNGPGCRLSRSLPSFTVSLQPQAAGFQERRLSHLSKLPVCKEAGLEPRSGSRVWLQTPWLPPPLPSFLSLSSPRKMFWKLCGLCLHSMAIQESRICNTWGRAGSRRDGKGDQTKRPYSNCPRPLVLAGGPNAGYCLQGLTPLPPQVQRLE